MRIKGQNSGAGNKWYRLIYLDYDNVKSLRIVLEAGMKVSKDSSIDFALIDTILMELPSIARDKK